jgi:hypothetical protein
MEKINNPSKFATGIFYRLSETNLACNLYVA